MNNILKRIKFTDALSVALLLIVASSAIFVESRWAALYSVIFFGGIAVMILYSMIAKKEIKAPFIIIFYGFFLFYVLVFSSIILLLYQEIGVLDLFASIFLPCLLVLSLLLLSFRPNSFELFKYFMVVIGCFSCFKIFVSRADAGFILSGGDQTNWANILGASLPLVFLVKNKTSAFLLLLFGTAFVFLGLKRSGMLAVAFYWVIFFLWFGSGFLKKGSSWLAIVLIFISFVFYEPLNIMVLKFFETGAGRFESLANDGGSGRTDILKTAAESWYALSVQEKIVGLGYSSFNRFYSSASSTHNDFMELLISYGFFGVLFLFFFYFRFALIVSRSMFYSREYLAFSLALFFSFLIYSNVSSVYFYPTFFSTIIVGYAYLEIKVMGSKSYRK